MKFLYFIILVTLISCASSSSEMNKWAEKYHGQHISQFIKVQGPPTDVYNIPGGGKIYSWGIGSGSSMSGYADPKTGMIFGNSSSGYTCVLRYTTDDKDIITRFVHEGSCQV